MDQEGEAAAAAGKKLGSGEYGELKRPKGLFFMGKYLCLRNYYLGTN